MKPVLCFLQLLVTLLTFSFVSSTKIIDYDNVAQNPYYRKSNLDFLIRRFCNFLQPKTTTTEAPKTVKPKFSDRLVDTFGQLGVPVKDKTELPDRVLDGLVAFIRGTNPNHEFSKRNMTDEERAKIREIVPDLLEDIEAEDGGDVYDV